MNKQKYRAFYAVSQRSELTHSTEVGVVAETTQFDVFVVQEEAVISVPPVMFSHST